MKIESLTMPVSEKQLAACRQVRKSFEEQGFTYGQLPTEYHFRGDTRPPEIIFVEGFVPRELGARAPTINERGEAYGCVSVTDTLCVAVGFANTNLLHQGFSRAGPKAECSWVYLLKASLGVDVKDREEAHIARFGDEYSVSHIEPEDVIAAFQIKTVSLDIDWFCDDAPYPGATPPKFKQILVTGFRLNPNYTDSSLAHQTHLESFSKIYQQGYFVIKNNRIKAAVDLDFPITHDLTNEQKAAFREFRLSKEEAQKVQNSYQLQELRKGFTVRDIMADWFSWRHIDAIGTKPKNGRTPITVKMVQGKNQYQVEALLEGIPEDFIPHICKREHVKGLKAGFTVRDIMADWFSWRHIDAIGTKPKNGHTLITVEMVRRKNESQVQKILDGELDLTTISPLRSHSIFGPQQEEIAHRTVKNASCCAVM